MSSARSTASWQRDGSPRWRRSVFAGLGLATLAACGDRSRQPAIGLLHSPQMQAVTFARELLDSLASAGALGQVWVEPGPTGVVGRDPLSNTVSNASALSESPDIMVVVGPPSSTEALLVAPVLAEASLPLIVPSATSWRLREAGPLVFRLVPDDSVEGDRIAQFASAQLAARSATVFHVVDAYGAGLEAGIVAGLGRRGIRVLDRVPYRVDLGCPVSNPYEVLLDASLRRGVPDVVVIAGRANETACLARAVSQRHPGLPVIAGDGSTPVSALRAAAGADAAAHLWVVTFWHDGVNAQADAFAHAFQRRFGRRPEAGDALVYDALLVAAASIEGAGADRRRIAAWLASLGNARPAYDGVTGPIVFGARTERPIYMVRVSDGSVTELRAQ